MKKIRILFFMMFLAAAIGCDPTDMVTYEAGNDEAFFEETSQSLTVTQADANTYTITVSRGNPAGAVSVPVSIQSETEGVFDGPASVEFADGELYAEYTVSFDIAGLAVGAMSEVTLTLGSETDLPYSTSFVLSVMRDYTWNNYATGVYTSEFYGQLAGQVAQFPVVMQQAAEKTDLYRLADVFNTGYHFQLIWDGSASVSINGGIDLDGLAGLDTGLTVDPYGTLYFAVQSVSYDAASGTFTFVSTPAVSAGFLTGVLSEDTFVLDSNS